jgi:hypothetical protein
MTISTIAFMSLIMLIQPQAKFDEWEGLSGIHSSIIGGLGSAPTGEYQVGNTLSYSLYDSAGCSMMHSTSFIGAP